MKITFLILSFAFLTGVASCRPGNEASTAKPRATKDHNTTEANASKDSTSGSRLIVSFISIGEGTDFRAKDSMDVYISKFQTESKKELKFESVPWGREGEVDYCFNLSELSSKEQQKFIAGLKEQLKFSELVQISENQPCKQRR